MINVQDLRLLPCIWRAALHQRRDPVCRSKKRKSSVHLRHTLICVKKEGTASLSALTDRIPPFDLKLRAVVCPRRWSGGSGAWHVSFTARPVTYDKPLHIQSLGGGVNEVGRMDEACWEWASGEIRYCVGVLRRETLYSPTISSMSLLAARARGYIESEAADPLPLASSF